MVTDNNQVIIMIRIAFRIMHYDDQIIKLSQIKNNKNKVWRTRERNIEKYRI